MPPGYLIHTIMNEEELIVANAILKAIRSGTYRFDLQPLLADEEIEAKVAVRVIEKLRSAGYTRHMHHAGPTVVFGSGIQNVWLQVELTDTGHEAARTSIEAFESRDSRREERERKLESLSERSTLAAEASASAAEASASAADRANLIAWIAIWVAAVAVVAAALAWLFPRG